MGEHGGQHREQEVLRALTQLVCLLPGVEPKVVEGEDVRLEELGGLGLAKMANIRRAR